MAESIDTDTISVKITRTGNEEFLFRVPTPREQAALGTKAARYRREDGNNTGDEYGLDQLSLDLYRSFAVMETLLVKADAPDNWPYSTNEKGEPVVDNKKFPKRATFKLQEIYQGFVDALDKFLDGGTGN